MHTSPVWLLKAVADRPAHAVSGVLCRAEGVRWRAHLIPVCCNIQLKG